MFMDLCCHGGCDIHVSVLSWWMLCPCICVVMVDVTYMFMCFHGECDIHVCFVMVDVVSMDLCCHGGCDFHVSVLS